MNDVQIKIFINEVVRRLKQKREYQGSIETSRQEHVSEIANVVYEKGYNMPGLDKGDYEKIILKTYTLISSDDKGIGPYLECRFLPGEYFINWSVRDFLKKKSNFESLSPSGKKLFLNLRKDVLRMKVKDIEKDTKKNAERTKRINKELQTLEESFK